MITRIYAKHRSDKPHSVSGVNPRGLTLATSAALKFGYLKRILQESPAKHGARFESQLIDIHFLLGSGERSGFENIARWTHAKFPTKTELSAFGGSYSAWKESRITKHDATSYHPLSSLIVGDDILRIKDIETGRSKTLHYFIFAGGAGSRLGSKAPKHLYPIGDFSISPLENMLDFLFAESREKGIKTSVTIGVSSQSEDHIKALLYSKPDLRSHLSIALLCPMGLPAYDFNGDIKTNKNGEIVRVEGGQGNFLMQKDLHFPNNKSQYVIFLDGADFSIAENMGAIYELIGRIDREGALAGTTVMKDDEKRFGRMFVDDNNRIVNIELSELGTDFYNLADPGFHYANADHVVTRADFVNEVMKKEWGLHYEDNGPVADLRTVVRKTPEIGEHVRLEKSHLEMFIKHCKTGEFLAVPVKTGIMPNRDPKLTSVISQTKNALFRDQLALRNAEVSEACTLWIKPSAYGFSLGADAHIKSFSSVLLSGRNLMIGDDLEVGQNSTFIINHRNSEYCSKVKIGNNFTIESGSRLEIEMSPKARLIIEDGVKIISGAKVKICVPEGSKIIIKKGSKLGEFGKETIIDKEEGPGTDATASNALRFIGANISDAGIPVSMNAIKLPGPAMVKRARATLTKNLKSSSQPMIWAAGNLFVDATGKIFLDFSSQTQNLNLGNNNPIVLETIRRFLNSGQPYFTSSRFVNLPSLELSQALIDILPHELNRVNLKITNGSDAIETALKSAIQYQQVKGNHCKREILSLIGSHHGETALSMACSPKNKALPYVRTEDHVYLAPNDLLGFKAAIDSSSHKIAGFILEPVQVNGGIVPVDVDYIKQIRQICTDEDICLIFDEVQTGFGWMGTLFASQYYDVIPDIMCIAKGLACGFPIAGVALKDKYDVLDFGEAELTNGMNPISASVAIENIKILTQTEILEQARSKGSYLGNKLEELRKKYSELIKEVRGVGLIWGLELYSSKAAKGLFTSALDQGVLFRLSKDGKGETLLIKPSLIVTEQEISKALEVLENGIKTIKH